MEVSEAMQMKELEIQAELRRRLNWRYNESMISMEVVTEIMEVGHIAQGE